ncbi:kinase-like protein [Marasmius fiardii PR-910]|nr:kinase-like protein [Marasmius fiardii PR-910]
MYTMRRFKTTPSHMWPLELSVLEMINDREVPFLPKICWRVFEEGCFSLIMNFYPGGSLLSFVEQNGPLSRLHAMLYASELVEALSVVHAAGIQHRNITPACLMIDAGGHIVLVDFEHTFVDTEHVACTSGTVYCPNQDYEYRAPELLLGWTHDYAVDCWGFGCILYFMMYGLHPFPVNVDGFAWQEKVIRGQVSYNLDHAGLQVPRVARELMRAVRVLLFSFAYFYW